MSAGHMTYLLKSIRYKDKKIQQSPVSSLSVEVTLTLLAIIHSALIRDQFP